MNLSEQDLQVLTNFSEINKNIYFNKGKTFKTINSMKNVLAEYKSETEIKEEFAIYDLKEFLNFHDLFENPNIKLNNNKIILKDKRFTSEYYTADKGIVVCPKKSIPINDWDYKFCVRRKDLQDYYLARKRVGLPDLSIQNNEGYFNFKITDKKNKNSNCVSFNIDGDNSTKTNRQFKFNIKCENFDRILIDDYDVCVSVHKIMMLTNKSNNLKYWIALEPDSEFDSTNGVNSNA